MKAVGVLALVCFAGVSGNAMAAAKAPVSCSAFMEGFTKGADGHKVTFERPLTIKRGFFGDEDGIEVRVMATNEDVEGTLKCRGEEFRRFEVRVRAPVDEKVAANFKIYEEATLMGAFRWDRPKVQTIVNAMTADAAEYLKASLERGDTYHAGKVEYHQGDQMDLGLIWTETDRTFIISVQSNDDD